MTVLEWKTVVIAMIAFAISAVLGVSVPPDRSYLWFIFIALTMGALVLIGVLGKKKTIEMTAVELLAQLLTIFIGGLFSGHLALSVATARDSGAEGFVEIASNVIEGQGFWIAAILFVYGLMFILQYGLVDFVNQDRKRKEH